MSTQKLDNKVNYISQGEGSPVILVHGVAASLYDWVKLSPELVSNGFHTFALDLLGHGGSAKPEDHSLYNIDAVFSHFTNWVNSLRLKQPLYLVGHSLGGYLCLLYSLRYPYQVKRLVLIDPFFKPQQLNIILHRVLYRPEISARVIRFIPEWFINLLLGWDPIDAANFSSEDRLQIANDYKRASPLFVYITQNVPDLMGHIPNITVPSLVIWGEKDRTLDPTSFPQLIQALPNACGFLVRRSGHQPHIGQPELVNAQILTFLRDGLEVDYHQASR